MPQANQWLNFVFGGKLKPAALDVSSNQLIGQGSSASLGLTAGATSVKSSPGRVCRISITTAGSAAGRVDDSANTTVSAATLIGTLPNTVGVYTFDWPCANGICVTMGTGQVGSVSFT